MTALRGTVKCILKICEIICDEIPTCNVDGCEAVLLFKNTLSSNQKIQLGYFLDYFKPVRMHFKIVTLAGQNMLDEYCMLDENAVLVKEQEGVLDSNAGMDGVIALK